MRITIILDTSALFVSSPLHGVWRARWLTVQCVYAIELYWKYCCQQHHHPHIGSRTVNGTFSQIQINCKQIEAISIFTYSVHLINANRFCCYYFYSTRWWSREKRMQINFLTKINEFIRNKFINGRWKQICKHVPYFEFSIYFSIFSIVVCD